jgi:AraC-like DNA-binding protein
MKVITLRRGADLEWIDVLAKALGGTIDGNFIKGNNELYEGTHYVLPWDNNRSAMMGDVTYKDTTLLEFKNDVDHFIGFYFYVLNQDINFILDDEATLIGKQDYNLLIMDCALDFNYVINKDNRTYIISIYIDKTLLRGYMDKIPALKAITKDIFDAEKNTIVWMDRMNTECAALIKDFMKITYDNSLFNFYFKGLINNLIGNYLEQLLTKKFIIGKVMSDDVKSILVSKVMLLESIDEVFPGVDFLAEKVSMSPSKYKKLFTKISGLSPGSYFYGKKIERAKELLETGQYTVSEVADKLNYANISYLAKRFNSKYGIFPKEYQNLL